MPDRERNGTAVEMRGVMFAWPRASEPALEIDHLAAGAGDSVFIRGPSGSGKSTLLAMIGGVLVPQAGQMRVLGADLRDMGAGARDRFRADHVGFIFQQFNLLPYLGVVDNVLPGLRFSRERARRIEGDAAQAARHCLAALGLKGESLLNRAVTELGAGQQQRVAAARSLLGNPGLVIADEPTSSLDTDARAAFMQLLFTECARTGATLLFVSHDPDLATDFDRIGHPLACLEFGSFLALLQPV